jgi:hypothetical protein
MNNNFLENAKNPHRPILFCVGERVFDKDWNEVKVTERKNWKYVVINREQVGISKLEDKTGYSEPVYFNYVFGGAWQNQANYYYDMLLKK